MVFFKLAQCIESKSNGETATHQSTKIPEKPQESHWFNRITMDVFISLSVALMFAPVITYFTGWHNIDEVVVQIKEANTSNCLVEEELGLHTKEDAPKKLIRSPVIINMDGNIFDLSKEEDRKRWKRNIRNRLSVSASASSPAIPESTSTQIPEILDSAPVTSPQLQLSVTNEEPRSPGRARTDINIHDPTKPVPSVLHFPLTNNQGKTHHRVFLPGRGWLSVKELEKERHELLTLLSHRPHNKSHEEPREGMPKAHGHSRKRLSLKHKDAPSAIHALDY